MNQTDARALPQLIQLLRAAFSKSDPNGVAPAIAPIPALEADGYKWHCARFGEASEFRIFAGVVVPSGESAAATQSTIAQRLKSAFASLGELLGNAVGQKLTAAVEEADAAPDAVQVSLKVQGISGVDGLFFVLDAPAATWFAANMPAPSKEAAARTSMMDTLMDVELPVSILLASRQASLSEVLQWGPGAIVEFEAGLGDPVDVIVNKQTVARGSVVLVDGNYGVRVTEVLAGTGQAA